MKINLVIWGELPLEIEDVEETISEPPIKIYPNIPKIYELGEEEKRIVLTYGVQVIYNPYKEILQNIRDAYDEVREILDNKVRNYFEEEILSEYVDDDDFLEVLDEDDRKKRICKGLFVSYIIHKNIEFLDEYFDFDTAEKTKLTDIKGEVNELKRKISSDEPIGIKTVSIPNRLLSPDYDESCDGKAFRSGKTKGKSIRYYYGEGMFLNLEEEKSRVIFSHLSDEGDFREEIIDNSHSVYVHDENSDLKELRINEDITKYCND